MRTRGHVGHDGTPGPHSVDVAKLRFMAETLDPEDNSVGKEMVTPPVPPRTPMT
ncbi:hypothetical protein VULLAG_LOCUS7860 [Vulpes lagopus]